MLYSSSSSDDSEDTLLESSSASIHQPLPNYKMAAIQYGFNNSTQNSKNDTNKNHNSYNRRRRKRMTSVSSIGSNSSAYNNLDSGYFSPYICSVCFNPYQTSSTGSTNSTYSPYMIGIGGPRCCCEPALVGSEHCDIIKAIPTTTPNKLPCPRRESCQDLINTTCYNNYANASGRIKRNLFSFDNLEECGGFTDNLLEGSATSIDQIITTEIIKTNNSELTKVNKRVNKDDLKLTQPNQSSIFLRRQKSKSPDFLTPQQQPLSSNVLLIRKNGGLNPEIHHCNQNNVKSSISGFSKIENPASQSSSIHLKADFHTFLAKESRKVGPAVPTPHHRLHLNPNVKTERVFLECKSSFELHNEPFAPPATKNNNKTRRGTDPGKRLNEKIELFGTKLRALGDEFESSLTTKNGGSFLHRSQNGGVCYANNIDNALNRQNSVPKLKYFLHQMLNQILNNILFQ